MKKVVSIAAIVLMSIAIFLLQFQYQKSYHPHTYYQVYLDDEVVGVIKEKDEFDEYVRKHAFLVKDQVLQYQEQLEILEGIDKIIQNKLKNYENKNQYLIDKKNYDDFIKLIDENGKFDKNDREKVELILESFPLSGYSLGIDFIRNYDKVNQELDAYFLEQRQVIMNYVVENKDSLSLRENEKHYIEEYVSKKYENVSYVKQVYMKNYVDKNAMYIYAEDIYSPIGINIKKINTYYANLSEVEDIYQKIITKKPCTIEGYRFRIKKQKDRALSKTFLVGAIALQDKKSLLSTDSEDVTIYVTNEDVFKAAVEKLEIVFVGTETFEQYSSGTQQEIKTTGSRVNDIYVEEEITVKKTTISIGEKIYDNSDDLSSYLLYGEDKSSKTVYASAKDNILDFSYRNGISVEEFFLSNPSFTSVNNFFYDKQPIVIATINPKISIAVEKYTVEDLDVKYETIEKYDSSMNQGLTIVKQEGKNGIERVSQDVKLVNGSITYVNPISNVTIKKPQDKIVSIGTKIIPHVGSLSSWYWPTKKGYTISSYYGWRKDPFGKGRELHSGLDISGTGYGSPVYASNNGTIIEIKNDKWEYGNHIIIDHNNGYYSLYAHMSKFVKGMKKGVVVSRGQQIGYVGSTGAATGPHLHFEIRTCARWGCSLNPLPFLKK